MRTEENVRKEDCVLRQILVHDAHRMCSTEREQALKECVLFRRLMQHGLGEEE
jgi:hypothetical protein